MILTSHSFAMLTGYPPFQSKTQEEIYKKVRNLVYVWPKTSECGNHIPEEAKSLVDSCLNLEENQRPEPDDIVEHPFFDMYDGCIPGRLEPACSHTKPVWLRSQEPRGDSMMRGYSLDYDEPLLGYVDHVDDPIQRYRVCKAAFFSICGVGRKPDGSARRAAGKNCTKTAYAECAIEEERALNPVIPLPDYVVYKYPHDPEGDWSLPDSALPSRRDDSSLENSTLSGRSVSMQSNAASLSRTQAALLAVQQRRKESQSHAATLRQQASLGRGSTRKVPSINDLLGPAPQPVPETKELESAEAPKPTVPTGGLGDRPMRPRRGVAASYSGSLRSADMNVAPQLPKSSSVPGMLTVGKTRSQSRKLEATNQGPVRPSATIRDRIPSTTTEEAFDSGQQLPSSRPISKMENKEPLSKSRPHENQTPERQEKVPQESGRCSKAEAPGLTRSGSTTGSSTSKSRSSIGAYPLFHSHDTCEILPKTSVNDVNTDLRLMLSHLVPQSSVRRRTGPRREPHAYVIKWVDYTNRYGIGYVLDDGSVGCVFKAENGHPASSVVLRAGEKHIRRKARGVESKGFDYSEVDQLVPRKGASVEFYENCDNDPTIARSAIRRAYISPSVFEVKQTQNAGIKLVHDLHGERGPADYEKIKRVKLVDQFGKYMIGSLGRHGNEGLVDDEPVAKSDGQFIKFYQRLGNVGVWGFGDGAFQVSFFDLCLYGRC